MGKEHCLDRIEHSGGNSGRTIVSTRPRVLFYLLGFGGVIPISGKTDCPKDEGLDASTLYIIYVSHC